MELSAKLELLDDLLVLRQISQSEYHVARQKVLSEDATAPQIDRSSPSRNDHGDAGSVATAERR